MSDTKYIVPLDFVRTQGKFTSKPFNEKLVSFSKNSVNYELSLVNLTEDQRENLKEFPIPTSSSQIAIKVEADTPGPMEMDESFFDVKMYVVFALILANREIERMFYDYGSFSDYDRGGQGDILPYAFVQLQDDMINTYYQSDYESLTRNYGFYSKFSPSKVDRLRELLEILLVNQNRDVAEVIVKLVIRAHTVSSVKGAQLYMNTITLFSCFESLFGTSQRRELCDSVDFLSKLQFVRHSIAHPNDFDLIRKGKSCIAVKHYDRHGKKMKPPIMRELTIEELEMSRVVLIDKLCERLGVR